MHHEPESTDRGYGQSMQRIGKDVAEKLDYQPDVFTVKRHIRGKWVCKCCERIVQAPVPLQIINKALPTTGLLAQVLVAKYLDHLPLYRQEAIFERAGHAIARSTLAQWVGECGVLLQPLVGALAAELRREPVLHANETPVAMYKPGHGKTHRAYLCSYCNTQSSPLQAVVFDFADSRGGQHARDFLGLPGTPSKPAWQGKLVCDDFAGYKPCFERGVTEVGCMAHVSSWAERLFEPRRPRQTKAYDAAKARLMFAGLQAKGPGAVLNGLKPPLATQRAAWERGM